MCGGSSSQQTEEAAEQQAYSAQLMQENQTQFGEQQGILSALTKANEPILAAGPSQQGYSAAELTAQNTAAMDNSADAYQNAAKALNSNYAGLGGGSEYIPSGAQEQMDAQTAQAGAAQLAGAQNTITQNNYAQGATNYANAEDMLAGASGQEGTTGATAGAATKAAGSAYTAASQNTKQNNALTGEIIGGISSAAGGMLGGLGNAGKL